MIRIRDWTSGWKKKGSDLIVTVISYSTSSKGTEVKFAGGNGVMEVLGEDEFYETFEPIHLDFQTVKDQMAELCNLNDGFRKLGEIVMKRLDPNYFEVGKLVYISNMSFFKRDEIYYHGGPEHPYKIQYVRKNSIGVMQNNEFLEIGIGMLGKIKDNDVDYTFPIYPARPEPGDAYWFLTRYDKPY